MKKNTSQTIAKRGFVGIDFMGKRKLALVLSLLLIAASIVSLATRGLNLDIDLTGGVVVVVAYPAADDGIPSTASVDTVRNLLRDSGYDTAQVQRFGSSSEIQIRLPPLEEGDTDADRVGDEILQLLAANDPSVEMQSVSFVGPQVGEELREKGGLAMLFALLFIMAYVTLRFQWKFSIGSIAALVHDVVITVGVFSMLQLTFNLGVLAAVLAVIGYSLNDTIVVFDRIRENFRTLRKATAVEVMNISIGQTLSRTLVTSFTTLLVLFALYFLGGEAINSFAFALIIGVVVGTYSSIYVASTVALRLDVKTEDLLPPQAPKEIDDMP